jgi:hypothetical protein
MVAMRCRCVSMAATGLAKLRFRLLRPDVTLPAQKQAMDNLIVTTQRYLTKRMHAMGGRALANTLRSLVDLNGALPELLDEAARQLRDRPADFNTQERCMLVGTFAAERMHPGIIVFEAVNRVCRQCLQHCALCSRTAEPRTHTADCRAATVCSELTAALSTPVCAELASVQRCGRTPQTRRGSQVCHACRACTQSVPQHSAPMQALTAGDLSADSAAQLLLALARYGEGTRARIVALASVVCPSQARGVRDTSLETLVNTVWALGVVGDATNDVTIRVAAATATSLSNQLARPGGIPPRLLRKAYHAQTLLRFGGGDLPLAEDVAALAAAEWAVSLWPSTVGSHVQLRFTRFLDAMHVPYKANVPAGDGRLRVDIMLSRTDDKVRAHARACMQHMLACVRAANEPRAVQLPVAVMLSSDSEYISGHGVEGNWTPCGPTVKETAMLEAEGFAVVRAPMQPVRHVPNPQFVLFVEKILQKAHVRDMQLSGLEAVMAVEVCQPSCTAALTCACMHTRLHSHAHACTPGCTRMRMHAHPAALTCTCMHTRLHSHAHAYTP